MPTISVIFTHTDFLIINKPAGLVVHGDEKDSVTQCLPEQTGQTGLIPCHRLDKETSGILVMARNHEAASEISRQFAMRKTEKFYFAVSDRKPSKSQGLITGDLQKSRNGCFRLSQSQENPCITQFYSRSLKPGLRSLLFRPYTGKTHQLRVVSQSLGAPILGDRRYRGSEADRMYLHAYCLKFRYHDEDYCFSALPESGELFSEWLTGPEDPWGTPDRLKWREIRQQT